MKVVKLKYNTKLKLEMEKLKMEKFYGCCPKNILENNAKVTFKCRLQIVI